MTSCLFVQELTFQKQQQFHPVVIQELKKKKKLKVNNYNHETLTQDMQMTFFGMTDRQNAKLTIYMMLICKKNLHHKFKS